MSSLFNSPTILLVTYCLLALLAALLGGVLPTLVRLTHTRLQLAISFVGGLMLGLSLLGMMPHALHQVGSASQTVTWLLAGFLVMFFLQRFMPFHHHDVAEGSPLEPCGHTHSLAERSARSLSWAGVAVGLSLHSIFDGLAMAAAVAAGYQTQSGALGLGTALAVILHKPFGALAISTLMVASRTTRNFQRLVIIGFALVTPLGALLFFFGAGHLAHSHPAWVGAALAFCAGTFLCIACADLLPELQFHAHDRVKLSLALLAGIGVAVLISRFGHVHQEHEHQRDETPISCNAPESGVFTAAFAQPTKIAASSVSAILILTGARLCRPDQPQHVPLNPSRLTFPPAAAGASHTAALHKMRTASSVYTSLAHLPSMPPQSSCLWTC